ncbi:hypothetical protein MRX96_007335 [Rhipicephalus microplus]
MTVDRTARALHKPEHWGVANTARRRRRRSAEETRTSRPHQNQQHGRRFTGVRHGLAIFFSIDNPRRAPCDHRTALAPAQRHVVVDFAGRDANRRTDGPSPVLVVLAACRRAAQHEACRCRIGSVASASAPSRAASDDGFAAFFSSLERHHWRAQGARRNDVRSARSAPLPRFHRRRGCDAGAGDHYHRRQRRRFTKLRRATSRHNVSVVVALRARKSTAFVRRAPYRRMRKEAGRRTRGFSADAPFERQLRLPCCRR